MASALIGSVLLLSDNKPDFYYKQQHQDTIDKIILDAKYARTSGNLEASLWRVKEGLLLIPDHGQLLKLRSELQDQLDAAKR